ncbi:hypothetical protein niasHS_004371 [Heterodera schachtii]|uniref:Uncharacterized protein n=1 Tax=Heterodera schachtii TaxID=97005 RepID=A0ABD2K0I8_HETSC
MVHSTLLPSITMLLLLLVCPSVFLRQSLMKCKSGTGSEEGMNDEVEYVCFGDGKCGAIFCSADNGKFLYNDWGCFIGHYSAQSLVKLRMDEIDHYRAQHKLPPRSTGDQWQCTSQFGAIGVNMSNALFVPPLVKTMKCKKGRQSEKGMIEEDNGQQISSNNICYSYNGKAVPFSVLPKMVK